MLQKSLFQRTVLGLSTHGLALAFAGLLSGCGDTTATPAPTTPPKPGAPVAAAPDTKPSTGSDATKPKAGDPVVTVAADTPSPKDSGCAKLPKITSIERWQAKQLGAGTLQSPESIAEDPATGDLYVSNIGKSGNPKALDADGFITRLSSTGAVLDAKKFPPEGGKLNGPKGILVQGDLLWVVDIDTVRAYDIRGKEGNQLKAFTVPKAEFANDIAVGPDGSMYVSDTVQNFIYTIKDDGVNPGVRMVITRKTPSANGVFWDAKSGKLVVCGSDFNGGMRGIQQVDVSAMKDGDAPVTDLTEGFGMLDGMAVLSSGAVLVSDWKTQSIWWVAADGKTREKVVERFGGPADFLVLKDKKTILVPDSVRNEIVVIKFEKELE